MDNSKYKSIFLNKKCFQIIFQTPEQGAVPIVYACLESSLEGNGGNYISNCEINNVTSDARSAHLQEKLFAFTTKQLNIQEFGKP